MNLVLRIMEAYSSGDYTAVPSGTYGGTSFSPSYSSAIDRSYKVAKERKAKQKAKQQKIRQQQAANGGSSSGGRAARRHRLAARQRRGPTWHSGLPAPAAAAAAPTRSRRSQGHR